MNNIKVIYKSGKEIIIKTNLSVETVRDNIQKSKHKISIIIDGYEIIPAEVVEVK
ncbi:hypothetical protein [Macrococcus animalis]|uniref:hypothetical protein n=1 Tax=Macrococcus animalis TaxID=3395467 RepID=UPI0039BDE194